MNIKEIMKKIFKFIGIGLLCIIVLIIALILWGEISSQYNYNHKYSIAMPTILGKFEIYDDYIQVWGLNKFIDDEIANLLYSEFSCVPSERVCIENRIGVTGIMSDIFLFPYHYEYNISHIDNNKILFEKDENSFGEIDLNSKTLIFTEKNAGINRNEIRKTQVITDNKEIEKLEKRIIKKIFKKRMV